MTDYFNSVHIHLADGCEEVSYEQYAVVISSCHPNSLVAFDFPAVLNVLRKEILEVGKHLVDAGKASWEGMLSAFKQKSIFALLKGVGFSLLKLFHAVTALLKLPSEVLLKFFEEVAEHFKDVGSLHKTAVKERILWVENLLKAHPTIAKISGLAVAGLILIVYIQSGSVPHPEDLNIIDCLTQCIKGNFSLVELFTTPQGLFAIGAVAFSALGIHAVAETVVHHAYKSVHWLAADMSNLLTALIGKGEALAHQKLDIVAPKLFSKLVHPVYKRSGKSQKWFDELDAEAKEDYLLTYPYSAFRQSPYLKGPSPT